jgi:hypothetical protein
MGMVERGGRPYYYRSVRRGGRVTSEYRGSGQLAELAASLDVVERERKEAERQAGRAEREADEREEAAIAEWFDRIEALTRVAIEAAGYRQHKRGEWRKRRCPTKSSA